ncbi:phytanoyl-CoA dioxygenase family protein [Sphingomonas sp. BIUV-7]|uniref:Phytanoyl-CoA dioxygenase family protein n=1 Tax=Sphingomonas natans TaxID=3063330 RepID=A0ABT8Y5P9_9SPHN|nr:phytanoyl-CoA dioxygenase family protein [Sphingomonas sp. BIUV-7]MDO6413644.1 phytanoyl-CoA dioxygenase family protein [Sphingomonas sp. BIUV-7]
MTVLRRLLLPWWALQLATSAKSFCDNPLIGSPRLNARGLHIARVRLAARMAAARRRRLARFVPPDLAVAFDRDGFVLISDFLAPDAFAALREQALAAALPAREVIQGDTVTRRIGMDSEALAAIPMARVLLQDRRWRGLIHYVGSYASEPLTYIQSILSHRHDAPPDPQEALHADTFHATVKAWYFLTDVAADEGPFTYVPGSHRLTPERIAWEQGRSVRASVGDIDRLSARGSLRVEAAELPGLGLPPPRAFAVPANTLIVADTHGFHARGPSVRPSTRVEIWAYGRRNPFLPWTGFDPLGMPGIAERRIPFYWKAMNLLARWTPQPWADVGRKRPADE